MYISTGICYFEKYLILIKRYLFFWWENDCFVLTFPEHNCNIILKKTTTCLLKTNPYMATQSDGNKEVEINVVY